MYFVVLYIINTISYYYIISIAIIIQCESRLFNIETHICHGHSLSKLFPQLVLGGIIGQVYPVETGVCTRINILVAGHSMDAKFLDIPVVTLQDGKSSRGNTGSSSYELE